MGFWSSAYGFSAGVGVFQAWVEIIVAVIVALGLALLAIRIAKGQTVPFGPSGAPVTVAPNQRTKAETLSGVVAIFVVLAAVLHLYLVRRYKAYAAFSGAESMASLAGSLFDSR